MKLHEFIQQHNDNRAKDDLRLGQRFVNRYIRAQWPQLFYQTDDAVSIQLIKHYLAENQYGDDMPPEENSNAN